MLTLPLILAALAAGAVGGVHCIGMCGGLSQWLLPREPAGAAPGTLAAAGARRVIAIAAAPAGAHGVVNCGASTAGSCTRSAAAPVSNWLALAQLHAGRLFTYALTGAIAGASGGYGPFLRPLQHLHWPLLLLGNLALVYLGLRLAGIRLPWRQPCWLAQGLHKLASYLPRPANHHPFVNGMAWGCMPCGLLYTVLPFALLSGAAWSGALLLLVFGLGTLPWLLAAQLPRLAGLQLRGMRIATALILCAWGVFGLLQLAGWVASTASVWCVTAAAS